MANTVNHARNAGLAGLSTLWLGGLFSRAVAWNEDRRTRNILTRLSSHELDDIGLSRGDIDSLTRRTF